MPAVSPGNDCFAHDGRMISVGDALARLRAVVAPVAGTGEAALEEAAGRILAVPLVSARDVPAFANVAMDGFAFAGADLAAGGPTRLRLVEGRAAAGHPFAGTVPRGCALRVLTGAMVPDGCDTVVMEEQARVEDAHVLLPEGVRPGINCRPAGEDIAKGKRLFEAGLRLEPRHLGVAAELGLARLPVYERLKVALLSSGDELVEPGADLPPGRVYDANRPILRALLARLPVEVSDLGVLPDDAASVRRALLDASRSHHVIVSSGGASRGDEDHMARTVQQEGKLHFWRIAMKPGRPLSLGQLGSATFVGLPGNPVASTVCFLRFARPVILALGGAAWREPWAFPVRADFTLRKKPGRAEMLRAALERREDGLWARRIMREGSGVLTSLTDGDGLVEVGPMVERVDPGDTVPFLSFAELGAT
ncbi:molybdopterin molybdotransferase MoeA [Geminicoccaceae bacterium 1502E]|nr:molybdopterin molybdotransferase MoeA [Geminicoccaceae bacterium 1502E]